MHEFKLYIESILKGLHANKKQKSEMFDEFSDHLGLLKQEFLSDGLPEEDAKKKAIESFGNSILLNQKLAQVSSLRTLPNFLSGLIITLLVYRIGSHVWMIYPGTGWPTDIRVHFVWVIGGLLGMLPFGYFISLFFRKANNLLFISCISIIYSVIEIIFVIRGWGNWWGIYPAFMIGCVLGGLLGLSLLRLANNIQLGTKKRIHVKS